MWGEKNVERSGGAIINASFERLQIESIVEFVLTKCYNDIDFTE